MGVRTDGATVNIVEQNGMKGEMQGALQLPWLFRCWCYAHWLELACKDGFSSSLLSSIQASIVLLPQEFCMRHICQSTCKCPINFSLCQTKPHAALTPVRTHEKK